MTYRLSICIPTFNRDVYLESLLAHLYEQLRGLEDRVQVVVSDNASTDATASVAARYASRSNFVYERRERNVGPNLNFLAVVAAASGEYCWIFGDDDVLSAGGVAAVLRRLDEWSPDLMHVSTEGHRFAEQPLFFRSFAEFAGHYARVRPRTLLDVTLITTAIFRRSVWNEVPRKEQLAETWYGHSIVMAEALCSEGRVVVVPDPVIAVRSTRAPAVEGMNAIIRLLHVQYLLVLAELTGSPDVARFARRERYRAFAGSVRTAMTMMGHAMASSLKVGWTGIRSLALTRKALAGRIQLRSQRPSVDPRMAPREEGEPS